VVKEKFEIIAIQMDVHKNGVLYLKELVGGPKLQAHRSRTCCWTS
jgi:hypothetical protein